MKNFPKQFLWGTATASYQIEGAVKEDDRGPSIWDQFSHTPGKVYQGHTGDIACDHYHLYKEDVKLLKELGTQTYRFSVAWPRIFPTKGAKNQKGIDFYKRLANELLENEITPAVTLYHWDLPLWIHEEGGWVNRDSVSYFVEYAHTVFNKLGDVFPFWITHNEPWCSAFLGYGIGEHAPGHKNWREAVRASHHILLSHGKAVQAYRSLNLKGQIGITLNFSPAYSASDRQEDQAAASRWDGFFNRWYLDPLFKSQYPKDMLEIFAGHAVNYDFIWEQDLKDISEPMDFLGINYYSRAILKDGTTDPLLKIDHVPGGGKVTDMGWEVYPEALYDLLKRLQSDYTNLPLYITENGAAFPDKLNERGEILDWERVEYLKSHLHVAHRFIEEGGNLKGFYLWSLLDNFEWTLGYSKRFGILYVDYETQQRIPKESFKWYQQVIANNGVK